MASKKQLGERKVRSNYTKGECPDCFALIPPRAIDGDECLNCGHVFYSKETTAELVAAATAAETL